jgi:zinc finger protein 830
MADVRSLLRSERAARRIVHPHLSYSATGMLICLVCSIQIKSEALWDSHLRSEQHVARLRRGDAGPTTKASTVATADKRKRKSDGEESDDSRKRVRSGTNPATVMKGFLPEGFFDESAEGGVAPAETRLEEDSLGRAQLDSIPVRSRDPAPPVTPSTVPPPGFFDTAPSGDVGEVDEDEWAAFERDIAAEIAPAPPPLSALTAAATISAPALTASEAAAQDEAGIRAREKKEAEVEEEMEDAVRHLEEEFDEMESLEERVRRLRKKREELRQARTVNAVPPAEVDMGDVEREGETRAEIDGREEGEDVDEIDDVDNDDDGDDWDEWRLRGA